MGQRDAWVGRITAKCRRRAAAPVACLFTYLTRFLTLLSHLYNFPPHLPLPLSPITLFAFRYAALPFGSIHPRASAYRSDAEVVDTPFLLSVLETDFCARAIFFSPTDEAKS